MIYPSIDELAACNS